MKIIYSVVVAPVQDKDLSALVDLITCAGMPIHEVKALEVDASRRRAITRKSIGDNERQKMEDLKLAGNSPAQIAEAIGCSEITVRRHLK